MNQQSQQLDQDVVNLTKAIRQTESGGDFNARGGSGEFGGYQFTPDTWKAYAAEAGVNVPLEQATREMQNQVAYTKIKQWKDQGYNVGQVASMWNAGPGRPNAYQENHVGTNSYGVQYDTPGYAEKVAQAYQTIKGGQLGGTYQAPAQPHQFTPATTSGVETFTQQAGIDNSLMQDVGDAFTNAAQRGSEAAQRGFTGESNPFSATLQTVGAGAGAVGDIVDAGLTHLPIVGGLYEGATELLGGAVQGAMQTGPGQKAVAWAEEHPEAARNIGAAVDIASILPFFKALKYGKQGLGDVKTAATLQKTEASAAKELESSLNKPQRRILDRSNARGQDAMGLIVRNQDYLPDVIERNGKFYFDTAESTRALQRSIDADEQALQNLLESTMAMKPEMQGIAFNIRDVAKSTIDDVLESVGRTGGYDAIKGALEKYFDSYAKSMRGVEFVNLSELNDIKRDVRKAINFDAIDPTGTLANEAQLSAGQSLMRQVEEAAKKAGVEGVGDLNKKMGEELTALKLLEHLGDGKAIKAGPPSLMGAAANTATLGFAKPLVDYRLSKVGPSTPTTKLKNKRPLGETGRKGLVQLGTGLALSGQFQQSQGQ